MSSPIAQGVIEGATIKARLLKAIRGGEEDPNVLGHLFGLNGHDLVKNLEQLRKEGFITMKWGTGDRVERVRPKLGAENMRLLQGHVGDDIALRGDNVLKLSAAINRLPWDGGWRKWDSDEVKRLSGLKNFQITSAMIWLREQGRIVQLGGGSRGVRIHGVRWRGERAPDGTEVPTPVESVLDVPEAAPAPSGGLEGFPTVMMIVKLGRELEQLLKEAGHGS